MSERGRVVVVVLAGALALLIAVGLTLSVQRFLTTKLDTGGAVVTLPTVADHYPEQAAKPFAKPEQCGLDDATIRRLAPDAMEDDTELGCSFEIGIRSGSGLQGGLRVTFTTGAVVEVMRSYDLKTGQFMANQPDSFWQTVTGLGDEAVVGYSTLGHTGRAELHFRSGAVAVNVKYNIARSEGYDEAPLGKGPTVDGALQAAAEVAAAIGAKVDNPAIGVPENQAEPGLPAPDPCKVLDEANLRAAGVDPALVGPAAGVTLPGVPIKGCSWASTQGERSLRLYVTSFSAGRHRGGSAEAEREFARVYQSARKSSSTFYALRGPGEKAMAGYALEAGGSERGTAGRGEVVFTMRNLVVQVSYEGMADGGPLAEALALQPAYAVAKSVAARLPK
ncbi:hypothetical protein ABZ897_46390 [Nonomuraea sp. NPDC046802]|uniref:hypothetical protein n=1 Tax=Nonomuraea sp. NPDC046802 TaxID=3154919 RepID=UPI0033D296BB